MDCIKDNYRVSDDPRRLDLDVFMALLATSYWAADRPRAVMEKAMAHSVCLGLYRDDRQVGFARAVTDEATIAWLCDVIVDPAHRGRGLGKWLVSCLLEHPRLQTVSQYLRTDTAHGLYEPFGFQRVETLRRSVRPA